MTESKGAKTAQPCAKTCLILITGEPGAGKTTLMEKLHCHYKLQGVKVGGFITREVNENGKRVGFRITDLRSGKEGWLAKAQPGSGPMYGRYCIILEDLEDIALGALRTPVESNMDIVLIDEIGPMEMSSRRFSAAISSFLQNRTGPIVATFKQGSHYPIVDKCLDDPSTTLLNITRENREAILAHLTALADSLLRREGLKIT